MDIADQLFAEDKSGRVKCGCYVRKPDVLGIKFARALVPLRHIDYHLEIVNSLLHISLKQTYFNPTDKFLEVDYSLPVQPESSVYRFEVEFQDTRIEGVVKEKEQAKKEFQQAKSEGRQVAMGTLDADSKDILNLEIGNIPPKTEFTVSIALLQEMSISMNTFYKLQVPSTISPRFINSVEGAKKMPEHMQQKGQLSGPADFTWNFKIDLRTTRKVVFFDSPSHEVTLLSQNQSGTETVLVMPQSQVPNKDFTFVYTTEDFHLPSYVLGSTDTSSTVMLSFIPKFCTLSLTDAYKAEVANKPEYEVDMATARGDYIFFIDRSGSMSGTRIQKAREALTLFLKSLPEDSYFNVISFGSDSAKMFPKSEQYKADKITQAIGVVETMEADMGGTEIYQPLKDLLQEKAQDGYPRHMFLLTDGGVSNTQGVIQMVRKSTKYCRVHTIGVGNGASLDLIDGCAKAGKGKSIMIADNENPSVKIIELLESTLTPLISSIDLQSAYEAEIESIVPNPKSVPYVLKNDLINFYVTFKGPLSSAKSFSFCYEDSVTKLPYKSQIEVQPTALNQPFVDRMAHLKVLRVLENSAKEGVQVEDQMYYVKVKDYKQEAIDYSVKHQVLSEYTAFICVGKKLVDGQFQQFLNKGVEQIKVEQPIVDQQQQLYRFRSLSRSLNRRISASRSEYGQSWSTQNSRIDEMCYAVESIGCALNQNKMIEKCNQVYMPAYESRSMKLCSARPKKKSSTIGSTIGNFFSGIGSKISNLFSSSKEEQYISQKPTKEIKKQSDKNKHQKDTKSKEEQKQKKKEEEIKKEKEKQKEKQKKQNEEKQAIKQQKKEDKIVSSLSAHPSVSEIVALQAPNGSWSELSLIDKLSKNSAVVRQLQAKHGVQLIATQLVVLWLQKHHNQAQYSLIIKKALGWIKKTLAEKSIPEGYLKGIQCI